MKNPGCCRDATFVVFVILCLLFFSEDRFALFSFLREEQEGDQGAGDGSAEVSLPADMGGECVEDVADNRMEGVEHIEELPAGEDAVEKVGRHQTPDGAAGTGMEGVAAHEVDEQPTKLMSRAEPSIETR